MLDHNLLSGKGKIAKVETHEVKLIFECYLKDVLCGALKKLHVFTSVIGVDGSKTLMLSRLKKTSFVRLRWCTVHSGRFSASGVDETWRTVGHVRADVVATKKAKSVICKAIQHRSALIFSFLIWKKWNFFSYHLHQTDFLFKNPNVKCVYVFHRININNTCMLD